MDTVTTAAPDIDPGTMQQPAARAAPIWLYNIGLVAASVGLWFAVVSRLDSTRIVPAGMPWWGLALVFYLAEAYVIHVQFRREAHTISLSEVGLVVGLYVVSPTALLGASLVGAAAALVVVRRQRAAKLVFNLAQIALTTSVAIIVFDLHAVVGLGRPFGTCRLDRRAARDHRRVTRGHPPRDDRDRDRGGGALLREASGHRRHLAARDARDVDLRADRGGARTGRPGVDRPARGTRRSRRPGVPGLRRAGPAPRAPGVPVRVDEGDPGGAEEFSLAVGQLLVTVRQLVRSDYAEIFLFPTGHERGLRSVLGPAGPSTDHPEVIARADERALELLEAGDGSVLLPAGRSLHPLDDYLTGRGLRDGIVAALRGEDGTFGLLVVGERSGDVETFNADDRRLLETFVGHASVMLENGRLERSLAEVTDLKERLRHQAFHDILTGLPNRALFTERVEAALAQRQQLPGRAVPRPRRLQDDQRHARPRHG